MLLFCLSQCNQIELDSVGICHKLLEHNYGVLQADAAQSAQWTAYEHKLWTAQKHVQHNRHTIRCTEVDFQHETRHVVSVLVMHFLR